MESIANSQTRDLQSSIAEATRASAAMENIAKSMSANVASVQETVDINTTAVGHTSAIGSGMDKQSVLLLRNCMNPKDEKQIYLGQPQRLICWGIINYQDIFGIERFTRFGYTFYSSQPGTWMAEDTGEHNDWS